jgi:hypothetical protein
MLMLQLQLMLLAVGMGFPGVGLWVCHYAATQWLHCCCCCWVLE